MAKTVAGGALGQIGGDLVRDSARTAGQTMLAGAQQEGEQAANAILLDSGIDLDVFVTKAF